MNVFNMHIWTGQAILGIISGVEQPIDSIVNEYYSEY